MKTSLLRIFFRGTLTLTCVSILVILLVDHFQNGWAWAGIPFFWTILSIWLVAPISALFLLIPPCRRRTGKWTLLANVAASVLLLFVMENSDAADALMGV